MTESNIEPKKMTKDQLKLVAVTQRIGQLTSKYEDEIAELRATATEQFESLQIIIQNQESDLGKLQEQLKTYQNAEKNVKAEEEA